MTVKEKLVGLLEVNKGIFLSGEIIAEKLGVSRGAVWKAVKALRGDGYDISAVTNRGYCLSDETDKLSAAGIKKYLSDNNIDIEVYNAVTSTNSLARERAAEGASEELVVAAEAQSEGRGRLGRSFFSPRDTGLYISFLLRPKIHASEAVKITTIAAVAVCEAIEAVSGEKAEIKWVNDVFVNGLKVCGILTEASLSMENGGLEYAVAGIGINIYAPKSGFPDDLRGIVGAVIKKPVNDARNRTAAELIQRFFGYYRKIESGEYAAEYKRRSFVIGKRINVISAGKAFPATAIDVDESCRLRVRYDDGREELLSSGEISIRQL